jgi:hypothetical protein
MFSSVQHAFSKLRTLYCCNNSSIPTAVRSCQLNLLGITTALVLASSTAQ